MATPTPAESEEYTTRLLQSYELIKAQSGGSVSMQHVLNALQTDRDLLRTLEECADWSTQSRHECYRELFIAVQQEERRRSTWNKKTAQGKAALDEAGMSDVSQKVEGDDAYHATNVTFETLCEFLPAAIGGNRDHLASFAPVQPESKEGKEGKEGKESNPEQSQSSSSSSTTAPTPTSKLHTFDQYHSTDVEQRLSKSSATNILDLNGCFLKRFPDLLPKQLRELKQLTMQRNQITHLPAEMGYCVSLERLICSNNKLYRLPESITRLPYLLALDVSDNQLEYLPPSMGCLVHLRYMSAANNLLESLPPSLGQLVQLSELNLIGNDHMNAILKEKYNKSLPDLLAFLQSIDSCLKGARDEEHTNIKNRKKQEERGGSGGGNKDPGTATITPGGKEEKGEERAANMYGIANFDQLTERQVYSSDVLLKHAQFGVVGRIVDVRRAIYRSRAELCTKVRGTPLSLKHVGLISLSEDVLPSDPAVLRELKSFDISSNPNITTLNPSFTLILPKMSGLLRLNLQSCGLKTLPSSTASGFHGLIHLQVLNISENQLVSIDRNAFVPQEGGGMADSLQLLDLSSNRLKEILGSSLLQLTKLQSFFYHTNDDALNNHPKVLKAEEESGGALTSLIGAFISIEKGYTTHTVQEEIRKNTIENKIQWARTSNVLDLSGVMNSSSSSSSSSSSTFVIPNDLLGITKDLSLQNNQLWQLPKEMALMFRLQRLDVSGNALTNQSFFEKQRVQQLESSTVPKPIFEPFRMLLSLDLSNNNLGPDVPYMLVKLAPLLQVLSLHFNNIKSMSSNFVTSTWKTSLKVVTLRGNPMPALMLNALDEKGVPGLFAAILEHENQKLMDLEELEMTKLRDTEKESIEKERKEKEQKDLLQQQMNGEGGGGATATGKTWENTATLKL